MLYKTLYLYIGKFILIQLRKLIFYQILCTLMFSFKQYRYGMDFNFSDYFIVNKPSHRQSEQPMR